MPVWLDTLRKVIAVPRLLRVQTAYFAFIATEVGTWVAILVYAYHATGAASIGLVAVLQLLPAALVAPLAGGLGQRFAGRRALAAAYVVLGLAMATTGVAILAGASPLVVYPLAVVAQASLTGVRPIQAAILPRLVGTAEQLTATNALTMVVEGAGGLLGPLLAGALLALASPGLALVTFALLCVAGAILVLPVAAGEAAAGPGPAGHPSPALLDGLRRVARVPGGLSVLGLLGARRVAAGALDVLLVIAAIELLGMGEGGAGYLSAAAGFGAIVGGASTLALAGRRRISQFLLVGALGWGSFLAAVAVLPTPAVALVLLAVAGVGLAVLEVSARTLLQRLMPVDTIAAAFGLLEGMIFGGLAVGALIAGPLVGAVGATAALVGIGLGLPLVASVVLPAVVRGERGVVLPVREIALLRGLRLFAPVPAPAVEAAARQLVPLALAPGEDVIREGEVGDRFYVIDDGEVSVRREGREVNKLGPGEGFGEIALLRDVPRTATVTAIGPVRLLALDRADFLLAITGTEQAVAEAQRVAGAHLDRDAVAEPRGG